MLYSFDSLLWFIKKNVFQLLDSNAGFYIINVAATLCDSVDVYGFWPFDKTALRSGQPEHVMYHYYEEGTWRPVHDMTGEFRQLFQLHRDGVLRMHLGNCTSRWRITSKWNWTLVFLMWRGRSEDIYNTSCLRPFMHDCKTGCVTKWCHLLIVWLLAFLSQAPWHLLQYWQFFTSITLRVSF